ncbi:unnamed protein product [Owenia fusiformis]|uniref:Uncharacterized protein n=1 Tax=Owenia fusiformis TaxID=6347 RepID=A0A8S4N6U0_OWEFU|nr:unnamed protein product [Owenia fusiformis]
MADSETLVTTDVGETQTETSETSETCTLLSTEETLATSDTGETTWNPYLGNATIENVWTSKKSSRRHPNKNTTNFKRHTHLGKLKPNRKPIIGSPKFTSTMLEGTVHSSSPKRRRSAFSMSSDSEQSRSSKKYKSSGYECDMEDSECTSKSGLKTKTFKSKRKCLGNEEHNDVSVCNGPGMCSKSFCFDCLDA